MEKKCSFVFKLVSELMKDRKCIYFDETSCHLWMRKSKVWKHKYDDDFKLVIPRDRGQSITVYGAITTDYEFLFTISHSTNTIDTVQFVKDHL